MLHEDANQNNMVGEVGFEQTQAEANGFTVRPF